MKKQPVQIGDQFQLPVGVGTIVEAGEHMVRIAWTLHGKEIVSPLKYSELRKYKRVEPQTVSRKS